MNRQVHLPLAQHEWSMHAQLSFTHGDDRLHEPCIGHPCYGFQRGNIVFTTRPPDSGYNSSSLPSPSRRTTQSYGRRCMSTCSIVLEPCHLPYVPPLPPCEICCGNRRSPNAARRAHTFTSHFCTRVPDKAAPATSRDAASQTQAHKQASQHLRVPRNSKDARKLCRSPRTVRGKSPLLNKPESEEETSNKPRTVHIDVYCTGSESSSSEEETTPQTVYEDRAVKVVHTKIGSEELPRLVRQKRRTLSSSSSVECSSLYPSQRTSMASVTTVASSQSSTMPSAASSSCAIFSDDSIAATSWKDTTDQESMKQSDISLAKGDSFEYENHGDRLRIIEKEKKWAGKTWRSPDTERKHRLQQEKHQKFVERRGSPFPHWLSEEDSSEESDDGSELAWSFGRYEELHQRAVKREDTVRRAKTALPVIQDSGSLSDSGPSHHACLQHKIDSPPLKTKLASSIMSPFTSVPGTKTDQLSKAEKFGTMIGTFRKPGHHVGPSKNPDCTCQHCVQYYEERGYRNRTRSLGDKPLTKHCAHTLNSTLTSKVAEDPTNEDWNTVSLV